ncbi:MAG: hypothetical protein M1483_08745 [Actinobacteria bacterium]|nr:hypothetical protein [Actinomycetota bacterium]
MGGKELVEYSNKYNGRYTSKAKASGCPTNGVHFMVYMANDGLAGNRNGRRDRLTQENAKLQADNAVLHQQISTLKETNDVMIRWIAELEKKSS